MSKRYEDLIDAEKLVNSTHFPGKTGPTLEGILKALQHQLDNLVLSAAAVANDSFQIGDSWGNDIELVGHILNVVRFTGESDEDYRNRVIVEAATFETVTRDSILRLYEVLLGQAPTITEPFITKAYQSGDPIEGDEGGRFTVLFDLAMTKRSEELRVASGGTHVVVTDDTIVSPYTDAVSETTSVSTSNTTIYAQNVNNFSEWGEIKIDDEWVAYGSKQTSPAHAFLECARGLYDSEPAIHNTDVTIIEGSTKAFLRGTNTQIYSSQTGTTIYLEDGPYDWDTYLDVQYKIANQYKDEFDTQEKLGAALEQLQVIGYDFKAAGIDANIMVGYALRSWFQASREVLTLTDSWEIMVNFDTAGVGFRELFTWLTNPTRITFFESAWQDSDYEWDKTLWTQAFWNGSAWERMGGSKGWYNVEISAHV